MDVSSNRAQLVLNDAMQAAFAVLLFGRRLGRIMMKLAKWPQMDHVTEIRQSGYGSAVYSNKTLDERLSGKFYTPHALARALARSSVAIMPTLKRLKIVDPFCGDGRLLVAFMEEGATILQGRGIAVALWDTDDAAVRIAKIQVEECAKRLGLRVTVDARVCNSFRFATEFEAQFDVCLTNPPWEAVKPDRREIESLGTERRRQFTQMLRETDNLLAQAYPVSQPTRKFSGWGTNLARVGTELAVRLVKKGGVCGIISPASLFGDQTSEPLRRWLIQNSALSEVSYYPAEARLFDRVDQSVIAFVSRSGLPTKTFDLRIYDKDAVCTDSGNVSIVPFREQRTLVIPFQIGLAGIDFLTQLNELPYFGDLEKGDDPNRLWAGREIDETGHSSFLTNHGNYSFVKGKMVGRFEMLQMPSQFIAANGPRIPVTANHRRIAWRDVSRPNQKRRIQATLIPSKWVAGNSLHVAYFRSNSDHQLCRLLGIMNSIVFEVQARGLLTTSHVSLGVVRNVRVPDLYNERKCKGISELCSAILLGNKALEPALEVACAKAYGISRAGFEVALGLFGKLTATERSALLNKSLWRNGR